MSCNWKEARLKEVGFCIYPSLVVERPQSVREKLVLAVRIPKCMGT